VSGGVGRGRGSGGCTSGGVVVVTFDVATTAESKAGRGGAQCARASLSPPSSPHGTIVGGQVARPDGRRLGPSERGASDHWRSHRPFLRHRLDDRLCPSTASCAAPARQHCVSLAPSSSVTQHQTGAAAAHHHTGESQVFFFFILCFSNFFFYSLRVHYFNSSNLLFIIFIKKLKKNRVEIISSSTCCVASVV